MSPEQLSHDLIIGVLLKRPRNIRRYREKRVGEESIVSLGLL